MSEQAQKSEAKGFVLDDARHRNGQFDVKSAGRDQNWDKLSKDEDLEQMDSMCN